MSWVISRFFVWHSSWLKHWPALDCQGLLQEGQLRGSDNGESISSIVEKIEMLDEDQWQETYSTWRWFQKNSPLPGRMIHFDYWRMFFIPPPGMVVLCGFLSRYLGMGVRMRKKHVTWWRRLLHPRELASMTMFIYFILFKSRKYMTIFCEVSWMGAFRIRLPFLIGLTLRLKLLKFIRLQLRCWFGTLWKELAKSPSCSGSCENLRGDMWYQWRWGHRHHMWLHRCVEVLEDLGIEDLQLSVFCLTFNFFLCWIPH